MRFLIEIIADSHGDAMQLLSDARKMLKTGAKAGERQFYLGAVRLTVDRAGSSPATEERHGREPDRHETYHYACGCLIVVDELDRVRFRRPCVNTQHAPLLPRAEGYETKHALYGHNCEHPKCQHERKGREP